MYAGQDWYHIAHTPGAVHVHLIRRADPEMGEAEAQANALGAMAEATRVQLGFPEDYSQRPEWDSKVSPGVPHASLLARIPVDADGVPLCGRCYREEGE